MTLLRIPTRVSAAADRPASYGNQTIRSTRASCYTDLDGGCDQHCRRPSDVYDTHRRTKLTTPETINRWVLLKKRKNRSSSHPLGDLGVTYALYSCVVELYSSLNFFRYCLRLRRHKRKSVEVSVSGRRVDYLQRRFQMEGSVAHQPLLVSE